MPFKYANSEIGIAVDVMRGKLSPDELPGIKAAKARRDEADAEAKRRGAQTQEWREVNGKRLAVPQWVTEAEARNPGVKYEFIEGFDRFGDRFNQWCEPAPAKSEALLASERFTGRLHRFDFITRQFIDDFVPPAPLHVQRVMNMLDAADPRRPYWDPAQRQYVIRDQRAIDTLQDAPVRSDLVSPSGYPLTGAPNIVRPGEILKINDDISPEAERIAARATDGPGSLGPASGTEGG